MARIVDNVRLPEHIESGARIGPTFNTSIVTFVSGVEETNSNWQDELLVVDAGYGIMAKDNPEDPEDSYMAILDFFRARKGRHRAFLFRDLSDYQGFGEPMRAIPSEPRTWQLGRTYDEYFRRITRPVADSVVVYNNGALAASNTYTIDTLGRVRFNEGVTVVAPYADFEFDIPVRFDQDEISASLSYIGAGEIPDIKIIQIRE